MKVYIIGFLEKSWNPGWKEKQCVRKHSCAVQRLYGFSWSTFHTSLLSDCHSLRYETPVFCKGDEKHVADMHTNASHILNQQGPIVWSDVRKVHGEEHVRYNTWLSFIPGWMASGCQQDSVCGGGAKHTSQMWMWIFTLHSCAVRPKEQIWPTHLINLQVKLLTTFTFSETNCEGILVAQCKEKIVSDHSQNEIFMSAGQTTLIMYSYMNNTNYKVWAIITM